MKNSELSISDVEMYSGLSRLNIVPIIIDLVRWNDVQITSRELDYDTRRPKKIYTITEKGEKKLKILEQRYWIEKQI